MPIELPENPPPDPQATPAQDVGLPELALVTPRREREWLSAALTVGNMGVYDSNVATGRVWWSPQTYTIFGVDPDFDLSVASVAALVHPEDRAALAAARAASIAAGRPMHHEFRIIRPVDGAIRWISNEAQTELDAQGRPLRHFGIALDITERKRAEDALRAQAALLQLAHDAILVRDENNRITFWNRGAEETYGYTVAEALGQDVHTLLGTVAPEPLAHLNHEVRARGIWEGDLQQRRKDGSQVVVTSRWAVDRDPHGLPVGVLEINRDITASFHAEAALARAHRRVNESLALLETLTTRAPVGLAFVDRDFRLVRFNHALAAITGLSLERDLDRLVQDALPLAWRVLGPLMQRALEGVASPNVEHSGRALDAPVNDLRHWMVSYYPVTVEGQTIGVGVVAVDVTHQKNVELTLKEAAERKDEFLAMLSHELRNPLAPIRNAAHMLRSSRLSEDKKERIYEVIDRQIGHLTHLVDDLLDMARVARGKIQLEIKSLDLCDVVRQAVETVAPAAARREHHLAMEVPAEPVLIDGDFTRLAQVFCNLLDNAVKYTDVGGTITIRLSRPRVSLSDRRDAMVLVEDNGRGLDAHTLANLFDPFYQADRNLDRAEGGMGIGLSLVKSLVELHGGRVHARSDGRGCGSQFEVRLPLSA